MSHATDYCTVVQLDLSQEHCSNYTGLGFKCVDWWECGEAGQILATPTQVNTQPASRQ